MEYINKVKLYGVVSSNLEFSHEYAHDGEDSEPYYHANITCNNPEHYRKSVVVRCYFSGSKLTSDNLRVGDKIEIDGEFINSKSRGLIDISVLVHSYKIVDELSYENDEVEIAGKVTKIFTNPDNYNDFVNFVVTEYDDRGIRTMSTRVVIWNRLADYVIQNLSVGDYVIIRGYINNSKTKAREGDGPDTVTVSEVHGTYFSTYNKE